MQNPEFIKKMLLLIVLFIVVLAFFFIQHNQITSKSAPQPTPTPIAAASGNIVVNSPYAGVGVPPDFVVLGKARVFENVVSIRVSSKVFGNVYYVGHTTAQAPDAGTFGTFNAQIHLNTTNTSLRPNDKLLLEVFQISAKDGKEIDKVTIPLLFQPALP